MGSMWQRWDCEVKIMSTTELYESNADFRRYVDHYCQNYVEGKKITVEEALEHKMIRQYAEWLVEQINI